MDYTLHRDLQADANRMCYTWCRDLEADTELRIGGAQDTIVEVAVPNMADGFCGHKSTLELKPIPR